MDYCCIFPDYDERDLYWCKEPTIDVQYCRVCNMVTNREEAILAAARQLRYRKKRFFFQTNDGVVIASERFYNLYHAYQMQGIEFLPMEKTKGQYICRFTNTAHFDTTKAGSFIDNGVCPTCKRSRGHHCPQPYRMIEKDEQALKANTFYRSDIEFAEDNVQSPLIWATSGIVQVFTAEICRLLYENVVGTFGQGDCAKG